MAFHPPIRPLIKPLTWTQILAYGQPRDPEQPEAYGDKLFDIQTYTDNVTTEMTFFQTVQADKTLGNMQQAGALPAATAFAISAISAKWMIGPEAGGAGGGAAVSDVNLLMVTGRPIVTMSLSNKQYGPWPLEDCGAAGGVDTFGYGTTTADANATGYANIAPNGGLFQGNAILLLPNVNFVFTVRFAAAQNISADRKLKLTLHGTTYRRVV